MEKDGGPEGSEETTLAANSASTLVTPIVDVNPPSPDADNDKDDGPELDSREDDERTNETVDGVSVAPGFALENAIRVLDPTDETIILDVAAGQTTRNLPENVSHLNGTNLSFDLDGLSASLSGDLLPLAFDQPLSALLLTHVPTRPVPSLLNNSPLPTPSSRTQWMPDFTFGPSSEHINIRSFLKGVEGILGSGSEIRQEDVAGWAELQALSVEMKQELVEECSVLDLLTPVADITSDPARLAFVRDLHNQATLTALGHTTESIKLPPEMRDRKRKRGEIASAGQKDGESRPKEGASAPTSSGRAADSNENMDARQVVSGTVTGLEDIAMTEVSPVSENGPPPTTILVPATAPRGGGRNRKGKSRAETEEVASDPALLELADTLKGLSLLSWWLPETAKHFVRKPRSSDVNVLTEVRPSPIPFILPEPEQVPDNAPSRSPTPNATGLWERTAPRSPAQHCHAVMELSILTPAPHPPHTPRHTLSLALLNSQTLEDISEALVCANRWIARSLSGGGGVASGACAVIEGTVYGDGDGNLDGKDYADTLVEYLSALKAQNYSANLSKKDKDAIMVLDEQLEIGLPMLSTRLDSIPWKLHKPYWFMHDGGCVHWITVSSISLLHQYDPPLPTPEKPSNWPYVTSLSPLPHRALCRVCARVPAVLAVSGDMRLVESPSLVCDGCWALLGLPKIGRDYSAQGEGLNIIPLVSPDGL